MLINDESTNWTTGIKYNGHWRKMSSINHFDGASIENSNDFVIFEVSSH